MANFVPALSAVRSTDRMTTDSLGAAGWRSLLLRGYEDPPVVEEVIVPATADHFIVLVTGGSRAIEGRYGRSRQRAHCRAGCIAMTAPGEEVTLRWRGRSRHTTLQLHLPQATPRRVYGGADLLAGHAANSQGASLKVPVRRDSHL